MTHTIPVAADFKVLSFHCSYYCLLVRPASLNYWCRSGSNSERRQLLHDSDTEQEDISSTSVQKEESAEAAISKFIIQFQYFNTRGRNSNVIYQQESIPVGCVPPAFVVGRGGGTVPGSTVWGGYGHGGEGGTVGRHYPLPVDGQLRVKTLPSYNFVCGLEI